jgi:hypothetical protein
LYWSHVTARFTLLDKRLLIASTVARLIDCDIYDEHHMNRA